MGNEDEPRSSGNGSLRCSRRLVMRRNMPHKSLVLATHGAIPQRFPPPQGQARAAGARHAPRSLTDTVDCDLERERTETIHDLQRIVSDAKYYRDQPACMFPPVLSSQIDACLSFPDSIPIRRGHCLSSPTAYHIMNHSHKPMRCGELGCRFLIVSGHFPSATC